jgi:CHAT domain-containing protein/tetratricopeptide (TPR) repeat protein
VTRPALESIGAAVSLVLTLALCALAAPLSAAQPPAPTPPVCSSRDTLDDLLSRSAAAFASRDSLLGLRLLQQAFDLATENRCVLERAEALRRLALADSFSLQYDDARQKLEEAASAFRQHGDAIGEARSLTQLGAAFIESGRAREGVAPLRRALELARTIGDPQLLRSIYENLAYSVEPGPEKDRLRDEAFAFVRATPNSRATECNLLHQWGDEQFVSGRYDVAFRTITEAAACFEEVGDRSRLGRAYVSLGRVYRAHGRLDLALQQYTRALELQRAAGDRLAAVQSLNAIAVTYGYMGHQDEALARLNEALDLARALRSDRYVEFLRGNIAGIYNLLGRYREAAAALEETLAAASENRIMRLTQLTNAYVGLGLRTRALDTAEQAAALAKDAPPDEIAMVMTSRAWAHQASGQFEAASADLQRALSAIEDLRVHTVPDDFLKRGFGQRYQWVFAASISLLQAQGRAREGIETAERARARAFLDLLASRRRPNDPAASTRPGAMPATFSQMTEAAARLGSTVVSFWVSDTETFVWVLRPDGRLASARIDVTSAALASMVRDATGVGQPAAGLLVGAGTGARHWRALYRLLLGPVREHLPVRAGSRLTIVPHGPLFALPFAALRDEADRYLVESYDIHYVPAVGMLSYMSPGPRGIRPRSALLVGDPSPDAARDKVLALPSLPWAEREVQTIAGMLESARTTVLTGATATEPTVRRSLQGKSLLHFATHGIVQNEERLASYLALAGGQASPGSSEETATDGRLTANETYDLALDADLIVLSGCRTALGPIIGDGVIGFTRGFLVAGASSVIATMWDVPDQTSFEVMQGFYRSWIADGTQPGKSRSLRQAQLSVLRALRAGKIQAGGVTLPESPRLWAGYVLVGQP